MKSGIYAIENRLTKRRYEETKEKRRQTLRRLVAEGILFNAQHRANMSVAQQKRRCKEI